MNCALLFLSTLLYLAGIQYHAANGLSIDDLDLARSAIETVAKPLTSKTPISRNNYLIPYHTAHAYRNNYMHYIPPKKKVKTSNKARNLNKFIEAMDQVERAMAQAELSKKTPKLSDLKKDITDAVNRGNVRFARRALGIALYTTSKETKRRGKRTTGYNAKMFLKEIRRDLGDDKFSDFLALKGQVSLMFALDVTGSMSDEIKAAKEIIVKISQHDRSEPVNFILTTFSDPIGLTTANYFAENEVSRLISHVNGISATGGEDCPEFTFDGMISALYQDPRWGSPLFVFTDAPPKDADGDSREALNRLAEELGATVNFFVSKRHCGSASQQQPFKDVVEAHGGQYLELDPSEMTKMSKFTSNTLEGTAAVASGKSGTGRRKRRATTNIGIPVDDTVTRLVVTVATIRSPHNIQLYTPTGRVETAGRTVLSKVIIFSVDNPVRGLWKLMVPSSLGKYEYSAKVVSPENIDFEHFFSKLERGTWVHLRNPLAGQSSRISITMSGATKIKKSSLLLDIINIAGNTLIANKKPKIVGKSGIRFTLDLVPPNGAFKLLLKGKTNGGKNFQRISRHVDSAKPLVVKEYYTLRHYTIRQKGSTTILFYLFNGLSNSKMYNVSFRTDEGYTASLYGSQAVASRMNVRGRSKKYLRVSVRYNGGTPGRIGETLNVVIIVRGRDKSFVTTEVVPLMIIKN